MKRVIVICAHCNRVLGQKRNEDPNENREIVISHSDCIGYSDHPCKEGEAYHRQLAIDLGFDTYEMYVMTMTKKYN